MRHKYRTIPLETIGKQIRMLREEQGLRQKDMADRLEMTQGWYSDVENGVYVGLTVSRLDEIANALGTPLSVLIESAETQPPLRPRAPSKEGINPIIRILKNRRVEHGIMQKDLANIIGTRQNVLSRIEGGYIKDILIGTATKIANALGLKLSDVLSEVGL